MQVADWEQLRTLVHLDWECTARQSGHWKDIAMYVYCRLHRWVLAFADGGVLNHQSIAYEIAPFNIKVSILQCSIEIRILTNLITSVPPILPAYSAPTNHAPLFRNILNGLLSRLPQADLEAASPANSGDSASSSTNIANGQDPTPDGSRRYLPFSAPEVVSMYPPLSAAHLEALTAETVHAITAIGGHENPPSRHIIGQEGVASVKEKLKTVSEELEDFIQASCAVDITSNDNPTQDLSQEGM